MNAERLSTIEEIYHAALAVDINRRSDFLSDICGDDLELRGEVETLLSFADVTSSVIDQPPSDVAAEMVAEARNSPSVGTKIKHYKIVSQIGVGGMGEVFMALDTRLERNVAIKFIKTEFVKDKDKLRRFQQEARNASSLNHPNILTVYEIGNSKHGQFIAAEFIEGKTLRKVMNEGELSLTEILEIAIQAATALEAAHSAGIIHRDIKPENIILRRDGLVKVLDFGLAKLVGNPNQEGELSSRLPTTKPQSRILDPQLTASDLMMGTVAYISPEQACLEPIDARSDVWSLSIVLFEMLNGRQPFKGKTPAETIASILNAEAPQIAVEIPEELRRILAKGLQKNAANRYQTSAELLHDLKRFQKESAIESSANGQSRVRELRISTAAGAKTGSLDSESSNISSAEYIFKKVGKYKALTVGLLSMVVLALAFVGYLYFPAGSRPVTSIAVMPFANTSGDQNMDYLAEGISESLVNSLSQLKGVKVIAQSSSVSYKGKEAEFEKSVRDFGGQFVLKGQISQHGDDLQVIAELVDVRNNSQIWRNQFNRKAAEISGVEAEISRQVAEGLQLNLTSAEQQRLSQKKKPNPQAYELLLKGRFYQSKSSFDNAQKAVEYYNQALAVDPNFAQAHAALASAYLYIGLNGFVHPKEVMAKAKAAAERAVELDDNLPEANLAMARIKQVAWDWAGAEREYKRALELNPNLAATHFRYALFLSTMGQNERAISEIKLARDLDPLKPHINLDIAYIFYFARQYDSALEQYEIGQELDPDFSATYYGKGFVYAARGKYLEAINNYKEMIRLNGAHTGVDCYLGFALARAGQISEARTMLNKLETGNEYVSPVELAVLHVGLDEPDKALSALERAYLAQDSQLQYLGIEPHFDSLRADPRFADLIHRIGLP